MLHLLVRLGCWIFGHIPNKDPKDPFCLACGKDLPHV